MSMKETPVNLPMYLFLNIVYGKIEIEILVFEIKQKQKKI
jgi:hypothetical protein